MRNMLIALVLIAPQSLQAGSNCVDIMAMPFEIIQKLGPHTYELIAEHTVDPMHIILRTKRANFLNTGHPIGIGVQRSNKMQKVQLRDGFTARYSVIEECAILPIAGTGPYPPDVAVRERLKKESAFNIPSP